MAKDIPKIIFAAVFIYMGYQAGNAANAEEWDKGSYYVLCLILAIQFYTFVFHCEGDK